MRIDRIAGFTAQANGVSLRDPLPFIDFYLRKMGVASRKPVGMMQFNVMPIPLVIARKKNTAAFCGQYGIAYRKRDIHTRVRSSAIP